MLEIHIVSLIVGIVLGTVFTYLILTHKKGGKW